VADQVDRSALPLGRPGFSGTANRTLAGSQPDWGILSSPKAPDGAPNVLVVLLDDAGFGQPSTFGGGVATPSDELTMQNGIVLSGDQQLTLIEQYGGLDTWGTEIMSAHYAAAWAWAGNCPFQWGKQGASHLGGTRVVDPILTEEDRTAMHGHSQHAALAHGIGA
jgi:hypothetical protein